MLQAQEANKARDWTIGMAAYDQVLATLKSVVTTENIAIPNTKKQKVSNWKHGESAILVDPTDIDLKSFLGTSKDGLKHEPSDSLGVPFSPVALGGDGNWDSA